MAHEREVLIPVQGSIYTSENHSKRQLRIVYSMPEKGMNKKTGILCLIPGYGGHIDSKVYHKMRCQFADEYNLAVLQCDYFGIRYMQNYEMEVNIFKKINKEQNIIEIETEESWADCNDMGPLQAMDIISMLLWFVRKTVQEENPFNADKIIAYGFSHGAYLAYLANRLCSGLLKVIIDNSAYIYPPYLECIRDLLFTDVKENAVSGHINYLVRSEPQMRLPREFYDLFLLYENFNNECRIISLHGTEDKMVTAGEKKALIDKIGEKAAMVAIHPSNVDGVVFKNAEHGLGADFVKLFQWIEPIMPFADGCSLQIPNIVVIDGKKEYLEITYEGLTTNLKWNKKF